MYGTCPWLVWFNIDVGGMWPCVGGFGYACARIGEILVGIEGWYGKDVLNLGHARFLHEKSTGPARKFCFLSKTE